MTALRMAENIYWVGAIDFDIREFHGYKTPYGTTYNAYLIIDEKITLIDSVKSNFSNEMIKNISEIIDPSKIDYVISNHVEPDHSGSIIDILKLAPNAKVYTTPNGEKGLKAYYAKDWDFRIVKTGDSLNTGRYNFEFIQTPMIHWPDNMVTYLKEEEILFSNDSFGQHYASSERYEAEIGIDIALERAKDYYANIVLPYDAAVKKALNDLNSKKISTIAPSHGLIWKNHIPDIIAKYEGWSSNKTDEKLAVIVYDTMWGATEMMARKIAAEYDSKGIRVVMMNLKKNHISEAMNQLMEAKYIFVGSSTLNKNILPNIAAFLAYMKGLAPKNRVGMAFGSYGWSGESIGIVDEALKACKFEMLPPRKIQYMKMD